MLKIISKNNNFKVVVIVIFILAIFQNFGFAKNIFKILKNNYSSRLINSYAYCSNESIGFLSYVKNKYKIDKPIQVNNYFISPNPSWFFFKNNINAKVQDKMILLGYLENEVIKFKKTKNEFVSISDIKKLKDINKIVFDAGKHNNNKEIKFEIYQQIYGERKKIYTSDLKLISKGTNVVELNKNFSNTYSNAKIIIKFINVLKNKNINFINLELYKSNEINLSDHIIYEKSDNCYLISKND
jgi:hypothetical protein